MIQRIKQIKIILLIFLFSCNNDEFTPKPKGYFRIKFPEKKYKEFNSSCPFIFQYPDYAIIIKDKNMLKNEKCWYNIYFPDFKAVIHITYKEVHNNLNKLSEDSRLLAYKHTIKANNIIEQLFYFKDKKVFGMKYFIEGNTASSYQFHITDSTKHFLRGSLYFEAKPNKDSIAPVYKFIKKDIEHLIKTFRWK